MATSYCTILKLDNKEIAISFFTKLIASQILSPILECLSNSNLTDVEESVAGLNGKIKHQFVQGGLIATSNVNNYFRSAHVTFETPYKTGTKPNVVATVRNYGNTAIDARLTRHGCRFICCRSARRNRRPGL